MNKSLLILLAAGLLATGCAQMRFSEFSGSQVWPTTTGTMADSGYSVPVYRGWPEKPYKVIGSIHFADLGYVWDDGDTVRAVALAKQHGGDAIVMRYGSEYGVGAVVGAAADPRVLAVGQVAALVIKWKTDAELEAERAALKRFKEGFSERHPGLRMKEEVVEVGAQLIGWLGLALDSPVGSAKLDEILSQVLATGQDGKGSTWLFKATVRSSALANSSTEIVFGTASVTQTGESVTIVSLPGRVELNFSGDVKGGRLDGRLGVSVGSTIFSGKAEGVSLAERISLGSQAQTADGLVQSNFTFIR